MRSRATFEAIIWAWLAFEGGTLVGYADRAATDVQGTMLLLMLVNFVLTLPGRAPIIVVAIASVIPLNLAFVTSHSWSPAAVILFVPAAVAAGGGRLAGRLLDVAATQLTPGERRADLPWYRRPLGQRFVLGTSLALIAVIGTPIVTAMLAARGIRAPLWVAMVWQIMTLLGWIGCAPVLLRRRGELRSGVESKLSLSGADLGTQALIVFSLAALHAILVVSIGLLLLAPRAGSIQWGGLVSTAFATYLPLDLLAYLAIVTLGFASDVESNRRRGLAREAALRTEASEIRLDALRARLDPHFLFNALSGVRVLAASGKIERSNEMLGGLTKLLRYVLDDRRPIVSLEEELDFAREYLMVQRERFGDRLRFEVEVAPGAAHAAVPQLVLQPLVENAVEHGIEKLLEGGTVRLLASRSGGQLQIVVENDGPLTSNDPASSGIGLTSTRERLERLYGSAAELRLEPLDSGRGVRAVIRMPFRELPPSE